MICKHCREEIVFGEKCPKCGIGLWKFQQCLECHLEKEHGVFTVQNINICGGKSLKVNDVDNDPDAFKPSWKS